MAHSLKPECTPLKHKYDACFNAWFEGYLQPLSIPSDSNINASPASKVANASKASKASPSKSQAEAEAETAAYQRKKRKEYEQSCGKLWEAYRSCLSGALTEKGLDNLLQQAREENPLLVPESPEAARTR